MSVLFGSTSESEFSGIQGFSKEADENELILAVDAVYSKFK